MIENKAELKEQLRTQEQYKRRNNIRVDGIEEDKNETWEDIGNRLRHFLYDELEINDELCTEKKNEEKKMSMLILITLLEQLLLSY